MKYLTKNKNIKADYVIENTAGNREKIKRIFDESNNFSMLIYYIDNNADYLLKLLEDSEKDYDFYGVYQTSVSDALKSRFDKELESKQEEIIGNKNIDFYVNLAKKTEKRENIELIGEIVNRIMRCKVVLWDEYYKELKRRWI